MRNVELEIRQIIADIMGVLDVKDIHLNADADELGMDSLDMVEALMATENDFDLDILDSEANRFQTVNDLVEYVNQNMKAETVVPDNLPRLENWHIDDRQEFSRFPGRLFAHGDIYNDPKGRFRDGTYILTSEIVMVDMEKRLVQTRNTLYRLGVARSPITLDDVMKTFSEEDRLDIEQQAATLIAHQDVMDSLSDERRARIKKRAADIRTDMQEAAETADVK